jgi:hypothetical protein
MNEIVKSFSLVLSGKIGFCVRGKSFSSRDKGTDDFAEFWLSGAENSLLSSFSWVYAPHKA